MGPVLLKMANLLFACMGGRAYALKPPQIDCSNVLLLISGRELFSQDERDEIEEIGSSHVGQTRRDVKLETRTMFEDAFVNDDITWKKIIWVTTNISHVITLISVLKLLSVVERETES